MPTRIGQLGVTFPDSTLQTTAAVPGAPGFGGFTNMSVYTTTSFWVVPAGITKCKVTVVGGGGGTNNTGVSTSGTAGGTSSFGSFCSATGGGQGALPAGVGVGGTLNLSGEVGPVITAEYPGGRIDLLGGASIFGGSNYGAGGFGLIGGYYAGSGGGAAIKIITGLIPGQSINVTVGAGGTAQIGIGPQGSGIAGVVIVEY